MNTFGAYQTYYESGELFVSNSSDISWIGSIQAFCLLFVGALTGPVYDAGHFKTLTIVGAFLVVFGQMMTSLCHTYWQVILAQAITIGLGCGCLFVPSVALVSTYFTTKVALALGIVASGSSLGVSCYVLSSSLVLAGIVADDSFRRRHLSDRLPQAAAPNRVWLGHSRNRLHRTRHSPHLHSRHARASLAGFDPETHRLERTKGSVVGCLCYRRLRGFHGHLRPVLLHPVLCYHYASYRRELGILPARNTELVIGIWSDITKPCRRQGGTFEHADSIRSPDWCPLTLPDWSS